MKDIYELLNEANIDVEEMEELEVSEVERKRGKKKLMASIKTTPKGGQSQKRRSKKAAIAASLVVIMGASTIFVSKPAWASNIPIIGDLIQNNLIDVNSRYKDYIQAVGQTKSDQGIDITFESAIADNNILNLSFVVKNNNDSIEDALIEEMMISTPLKVNGKEVITESVGTWEIIDKNTARVLKQVMWDYKELPNKLNIDIEIAKIFEKTGNWDINFALDVEEIRKDTYVEKLDKIINIKDVDVNLTEVIMTPLTTSIKSYYEYTGEDLGIIDFMIIDGDGNGVKKQGYGGSSTMTSKIFEQSHEYINNANTKTLNIIPLYKRNKVVDQIVNEEKLQPFKIDVESFSKINLKVNEELSIDINDVVVDGEYLIVKYAERYLDARFTSVTSMHLGRIYVNADEQEVSEKEDSNEDTEKKIELYSKYNEKNKNDLVRVFRIGDSKDIEIGAYDGTSIEILKEQGFTVTKK